MNIKCRVEQDELVHDVNSNQVSNDERSALLSIETVREPQQEVDLTVPCDIVALCQNYNDILVKDAVIGSSKNSLNKLEVMRNMIASYLVSSIVGIKSMEEL